MENKIDIAIDAFYNGYNCAQAVIKAFTKTLELDEEQAMGMAAGFGAGMGRLQTTCGAVTGAYMVIGLWNNRQQDTEQVTKTKIPAQIQAFQKAFRQAHQSDQCSQLLGCDLNTEPGRQQFKTNDLKAKVCSACIRSSVTRLEKMMNK